MMDVFACNWLAVGLLDELGIRRAACLRRSRFKSVKSALTLVYESSTNMGWPRGHYDDCTAPGEQRAFCLQLDWHLILVIRYFGFLVDVC